MTEKTCFLEIPVGQVCLLCIQVRSPCNHISAYHNVNRQLFAFTYKRRMFGSEMLYIQISLSNVQFHFYFDISGKQF